MTTLTERAMKAVRAGSLALSVIPIAEHASAQMDFNVTGVQVDRADPFSSSGCCADSGGVGLPSRQCEAASGGTGQCHISVTAITNGLEVWGGTDKFSGGFVSGGAGYTFGASGGYSVATSGGSGRRIAAIQIDWTLDWPGSFSNEMVLQDLRLVMSGVPSVQLPAPVSASPPSESGTILLDQLGVTIDSGGSWFFEAEVQYIENVVDLVGFPQALFPEVSPIAVQVIFACSAGDLAAPYGTLNFDDIDAFVSSFLASDLFADVDGNGVLNFDDIDAFVAGFLGGCD